MDELRIDRLTLDVSGLSEAEGARLATLVADRLAVAELPAEAAPGGVLRVDLRAGAGADLHAISEEIVASIARRLARSG